jgi:hypothetical protein
VGEGIIFQKLELISHLRSKFPARPTICVVTGAEPGFPFLKTKNKVLVSKNFGGKKYVCIKIVHVRRGKSEGNGFLLHEA